MRFLVFALLVGCATSGKKTVDIGNVKDEDFRPVKQINYSTRSDFNQKVQSENSEATNDESISRLLWFDGEIEDKTIWAEVAELCYEKEFDSAFELLKQKSRSYTKNPAYWNLVGTCYLRKKERRLALLFINKAIDLNSRYAPAYNNLGVMYLNENDYPRAQISFEKAIRIDNYAKTPRLNLASLFLEYGLFQEARSLLIPLYNSSKKDIQVLNLMGVSYLMEQDIKRAQQYLTKISNSYFERAEFGVPQAMLAWGQGKKDKAKDILEDIDQEKGHWKDYLTRLQKAYGVKI